MLIATFLANIGEWPISVIGFGLVWVVVVIGVSGVGWYVMHMDGRNRVAETADDTPTHSH